MEIMGCRLNELQNALAGYEATQTHLVGMTCRQGQAVFGPSGFGDDPGLYYFVPKIARLFLIELPLALDVFFYSLMGLACIMGLSGLCLCFRRWDSRLLSTAGYVGFLAFCSHSSDVYLIAPTLVVALAPWGLYFLRRESGIISCSIFAILAGILIGYGNLLRTHSGTGVLLFLATLFLTDTRWSWQRRVWVVCLMFLGLLVPKGHFASLYQERDAFLRCHNEDYTPPPARHPFWHSVYIGFGYIHNNFGIQYSDECAQHKVKELTPRASYGSAEYTRTLKRAIRDLWIQEPQFIFQTIFAKLGVMLFFFLYFANLGILAALLACRNLWEEIAFSVALLFCALPGMLVMPLEAYVLGFLGFAALYKTYKLACLTEQLSFPHAALHGWIQVLIMCLAALSIYKDGQVISQHLQVSIARSLGE